MRVCPDARPRSRPGPEGAWWWRVLFSLLSPCRAPACLHSGRLPGTCTRLQACCPADESRSQSKSSSPLKAGRPHHVRLSQPPLELPPVSSRVAGSSTDLPVPGSTWHVASLPPFRSLRWHSFWTVILWLSTTARFGALPVHPVLVNNGPLARARVAAVQSRVAALVVSGPRAPPLTSAFSSFRDGLYWCSKCHGICEAARNRRPRKRKQRGGQNDTLARADRAQLAPIASYHQACLFHGCSGGE